MLLKISKILIKTILYSVIGLLLLAVLAVFLGRSSYVQTRLAQHYAPIISEKLGYLIEIDKITLRFMDEATLEGVRVKDYQGNQMLDIERLDVDFDAGRLLNLTVPLLGVEGDSTKTRLDYVRLYHPVVKLVTDKNGDLNIDEFIRRINKLTASPNPKPKTTKPVPFIITEADIVDAVFSMDDEAEPYMHDPKSFDHYHFKLNDFNAHLNDFTIIRDTVAFRTTLRAYDKASDFRIKTLKTNFLISDTQMRFDDLLLRVNNTVVRNKIKMSFKTQKDFKYWNSRVRMQADFDSSFIVTNDIARIVNSMYQFKDSYYLNGKFDGTVNDFKLQNFDLYFGKKSKLHGDFAFKGLPSIPKTMMDLKMRKSYVNISDLEKYIGKDVGKTLEKFGHVMFDGTFKGTTTNFKTTGLMESELGKVDVDLAMILKPNSANSSYDGSLKLNNFKLSKLIEDAETFGDLTLSGKVKGQGLSIKNAVLDFDGTVNQFTYNKYSYKNIRIDGKLSKELFDGRLAVKDTNLTFDLFGKIDLRNGIDQVDMLGKISKANLKNLNFTNDDIRISTILDVQSRGRQLDNLVGRANFLNFYLTLGKKNLVLDSLQVISQLSENNRRLAVLSDLANFNFTGQFNPSQALKDLKVLVEEYKIYFTGDEATRQAYYATKPAIVPQTYKIDYQFFLKNFDPILSFVYPDAHVSKKTLIEGNFGIGNTSTFSLTSKIDTLLLSEKYRFYKSEIDLNSSKFYNNPEVLASLIMNSQNQKMSVLSPTENLEIEASWEKDRIGFTSGLKQIGTSNKANLNGTLRFIEDGLELQFKKSKFRLLDQNWNINPDNLVTIIGNEIKSKDLIINNLEQFIALDGLISQDSLQPLKFRAKNFKLETLSPLISLNIKGLVNGEVDLKNIYKNVNAESNLKVEGLAVDDFLIGNIAGNGVFDNEKQLLNLDYSLERLNNKILTVKGIYDPKSTEKSLDLLATLNQTNLQILEPFVKGVFSKMGGTANGNLNITGKLSHPIIEGAIDIKKGSLFFDYLKSTLNFEDKITFEPDEIRAKSLRLTDDEGNKGTLKGSVFYDGDKTFNVQLLADVNRFKILNTERKDNDMYYGVAHATGTLKLGGTFDNLSIDADVKNEGETRLYLPFDKAQDAGSQEDIEFLSVILKKDSTSKKQGVSKVNTSGIKMDMNFELTPDAYGEVQFDKQTGDIMHANGSGKINLKLDTRGGFDMTGDYNIERGDYTFSFQNIVKKKFNISRGSRISWSGNPYEAIVDIKAIYTQNLSYLGSVIDTTGRSADFKNKTEFTRRYPVDVSINLKDRLLQPTVTFDLKMRDYPQNSEFNSNVTSFENKIKTDEQELNRQVSNVLLLNAMSPQGAGAFANYNVISSLTELFSNQISNVFSQIDPNLMVDLTTTGTAINQDLINNIQLRMTYNINDRFRITRSGGFTTAANQADAKSLIGDIALEWFITRDGSLRLKTYNRNLQTSTLGTGSLSDNQTFRAGGASILYTKSFNAFFSDRKKSPNPTAERNTALNIKKEN
jgi:TamB, inner membrane protein subunit of TAM complex